MAHRDNSLGEGVLYRTSDYAGFWRRLLAIAVDVGVLAIFGITVWFFLLAVMWYGMYRDPTPTFAIFWLAGQWLYLCVLLPSPLRTVGYRLAGLRIVNLQGERPSVFRMTARMLLSLWGPLNLFVDLLWLFADPDRQSLRDCLCGTCVVRHTAAPIGNAPIHLIYFTALAFAPIYPRVVGPSSQP